MPEEDNILALNATSSADGLTTATPLPGHGVRKIMLVAGEPSGDALGTKLMRALKTLAGPDLTFCGVGGRGMIGEGLQSLFPIDELAMLGLADVVPAIPKILKRVRSVVSLAEKERPDAVVLIDSSGFNDRIAARLKKAEFPAPIIKYVAPQVWASRPWRVQILKNFYDHVLTLYPFEPPYLNDGGLPATFVGHPITEKEEPQLPEEVFRQRHSIPKGTPLLCLLPGSRTNEARYLLPVFRDTVARLQKQLPDLKLMIPTTDNMQERIRAEVNKWPIRSAILSGGGEKYTAFRVADAALAASGTVAMELAMCGTPSVVAYKVGWLTGTLIRPFILTRYLSLINIVADEEIIPEFVQERCHAQLLSEALFPLLTNKAAAALQRKKMLAAFAALRRDGVEPSRQAAEMVLKLSSCA